MFDSSTSAYVSHLRPTVKLPARWTRPWTLKSTQYCISKRNPFQPGERERGRERKTVCGGERVKESQRVKPKYYYTCYNSLLFQWQGSWSEGDFITLQVIASYIKLGWPQFLGSTNVWLPVKLTALHHRVIRLACWLCIKQEQTQLAALLRLRDGEIMMKSTVAFCTGRSTERGRVGVGECGGHYITFEHQFQTLNTLPSGHGGLSRAPSLFSPRAKLELKKMLPPTVSPFVRTKQGATWRVRFHGALVSLLRYCKKCWLDFYKTWWKDGVWVRET